MFIMDQRQLGPRLEMLNTLVNERLSIAGREIFGIAARIIWEVENQYKTDMSRLEQENERQRKLLDAMLNPGDVRLHRAKLLDPPVKSEEICPQKKGGNRCPDQGGIELPQNCRRQEDLAEANISKVTSVLMESNLEENTPPLQGDMYPEREECEIQTDTSMSVKEEPLKGTVMPCTISEGDDEQLSTQRALSKVRELPLRRVAQKLNIRCTVKEHGCEDPPKNNVMAVKGKRSPVKKSKKSLKPCEKRKSSSDLSSPLGCKVCNKSFNSEADLIKHVDVHLNDCGLCGHRSEDSESLKVHHEAHRTCNVCGKKFTASITLAKHMRDQHTEGKSLTCTICCKVFSNERLLKSHMRVHSTEKPYSCTVCDKSFRHSSTLDKHMLLHTGEKMHSCKICGRRFRQKEHVTQHESIHTGAKPFKCNVCDESFRQKSTMRKHMSRHTKHKPYECLVCGKKLSREDSMRRHRKLHDRGNKGR